MDAAKLMTTTLRTQPWGLSVVNILAAALNAVEPGAAVRRWLRREGDALVLDHDRFPLASGGRVFVVAVGKAGLPMAEAALAVVGDRVTAGVVVTKAGYAPAAPLPERIRVFGAGHPVPDEQSVAGAQAVADLLAPTTEQDLVLTLISGGGSALFTLPVPGVSLAEMQTLTNLLLASGATITEFNTLRKHLDQVKGGGLAALAAPATVLTLILSDVVGNPLDVIASGPTVADSSTYADCQAILDRYGIADRVPASILDHLRRGAAGIVAETPKTGDPRFARVTNRIVGDNAQAANEALRRAQIEGFHTLLLTTYMQGEAREAGRLLTSFLRELSESERLIKRPACLVVGGETTVTLRGDGKGGRNQELALGAVRDIAGIPYVALVTLATDGVDGPTDAAGAVVTGKTLERARAAGLDPEAALARNDAYPFFAALGDLLMPGPTQTNVNDLTLLFVW